ncbi:hypothetical protein ACFRAQ_13650 [Nocardia sp. NPDC056611]|uniref:hypothetical protein n=1 Tax=Nocardia sp. NPDC056611 TaxID=3345877 RepID=UPI00366AA897
MINYTTTSTGTSTLINTDAGSMVAENGVFKIKAPDGTTVGGSELSFRVDDFVFPIATEINDRVATLTPQFDLSHAQYKPVALPYEDQAPWKNAYDREQAAWNRMRDTIGMGATIGSTVGVVGGAAAGCALGGLSGAALTGALATMLASLPAGAQGCVAGVAAGGFLGTLAGQVFVTAPVAIAAAAQYFTTINQPMPNQPPTAEQSK